jgi:hypothetical protein
VSRAGAMVGKHRESQVGKGVIIMCFGELIQASNRKIDILGVQLRTAAVFHGFDRAMCRGLQSGPVSNDGGYRQPRGRLTFARLQAAVEV